MTYTWRPATGPDIKDIINISYPFLDEVETIWTIDEITFTRNLTLAIVNQFFSPTTELLSVAVDTNNNIVAYTWAKPGEASYWSNEQMLSIKLAHVKIDLPTKHKILLIKDMFDIWEGFSALSNISIIASNTVRKEQSTFLKLHERRGYQIRGSFAYKKLNT